MRIRILKTLLDPSPRGQRALKCTVIGSGIYYKICYMVPVLVRYLLIVSFLELSLLNIFLIIITESVV